MLLDPMAINMAYVGIGIMAVIIFFIEYWVDIREPKSKSTSKKESAEYNQR